MQTKLPLDGNPATTAHVISALSKMGLHYELKATHLNGRAMFINIEHETPLDLYYLGANVVAEAVGMFKSTLTR